VALDAKLIRIHPERQRKMFAVAIQIKKLSFFPVMLYIYRPYMDATTGYRDAPCVPMPHLCGGSPHKLAPAMQWCRCVDMAGSVDLPTCSPRYLRSRDGLRPDLHSYRVTRIRTIFLPLLSHPRVARDSPVSFSVPFFILHPPHVH